MSNQIQLGYCHCGCGMKTKIAHQSFTKLGWKKGEPIRYINHHNKLKHIHYVDSESGCWEWQLVKNNSGYGQVRTNKKTVLAHRYYYEKYKGNIPVGLTIEGR